VTFKVDSWPPKMSPADSTTLSDSNHISMDANKGEVSRPQGEQADGKEVLKFYFRGNKWYAKKLLIAAIRNMYLHLRLAKNWRRGGRRHFSLFSKMGLEPTFMQPAITCLIKCLKCSIESYKELYRGDQCL
jgi:hypothetical protein